MSQLKSLIRPSRGSLRTTAETAHCALRSSLCGLYLRGAAARGPAPPAHCAAPPPRQARRRAHMAKKFEEVVAKNSAPLSLRSYYTNSPLPIRFSSRCEVGVIIRVVPRLVGIPR